MADHASKDELDERAEARRAIVRQIKFNVEGGYQDPNQLLAMAQALQLVAGDAPDAERKPGRVFAN